MYDTCTKENCVTQIDLGGGILNTSILKNALEKALSCMVRCRKKREKQLPCASCETFHFTNCHNFVQTIISIQNIVSKILGSTACDSLSKGQVSISGFTFATNKMLACIKALDNVPDENAQEKFLTHLRSLHNSLNKKPTGRIVL
ncbi:TPA: hypothetical protein DEP58_00185 [Patescibacteria group bacterium]|nr:MAG: hypothetical protein UU98_C0002G0054 [Parcubacteria group bacterium GW2011_GWD2_42_14]HCC04706.1 hypothetical protein [Patescibacteria group bacterium]